MPRIEIKTVLNSDIETCFNLARNIDFHQESFEKFNERAIGGKTSGLIELNEWVTWEAKHIGFVQHLTAKITEFEAPNYFVDEMVFGALKSFRHEHKFRESENNTTVMTELFYFESPFGVFGKLANVLFLKRYIKSLLKTRNEFLKEKAETC